VSVITIRDLPARHALYCDGSKGRVWKVVWQVAWRAGQAVVGKGDQHVAPDRRHAPVVLASVVVSTFNASSFERVNGFRLLIGMLNSHFASQQRRRQQGPALIRV